MSAVGLPRAALGETARRLAESARTPDGAALPGRDLPAWFAQRRLHNTMVVTPVPFARAKDWLFDPGTGNLVHRAGAFFSIEGVAVDLAGRSWTQPIIVQPEVGILGILVKEIGGVLHCLMQAKIEPGNSTGLQLAPTVQATRSNYGQVHNGKAVPYLDYFTMPGRGRVLADVLQSEQGSWFLGKRNRNTVIEVAGDVPVGDDFCWLALGQVYALLRADNIVNMDARSVLACLPAPRSAPPPGADPFTVALARGFAPGSGAAHRTEELLGWFTGWKARGEPSVIRTPLRDVRHWTCDAESISHDAGRHFRVIAVDVQATSREVGRWTQPLLAPVGRGVVAFLARRIDGVLHLLVQARAQHGYLDRVELAPTVQCIPESYRHAEAAPPPFLDYVLGLDPSRIRYDAIQSEEGGRFHHAENRYVIAEVEPDFSGPVPEAYRWMAPHQLTELVRHSHYLNVEARSLLSCLHTLW